MTRGVQPSRIQRSGTARVHAPEITVEVSMGPRRDGLAAACARSRLFCQRALVRAWAAADIAKAALARGCRQPPNASRSGSIALAPNIRQSPAAMGNSTRRVRRRAATACGRVPPDRALGDQLSTLAWTRGTGGAPSESS